MLVDLFVWNAVKWDDVISFGGGFKEAEVD